MEFTFNAFYTLIAAVIVLLLGRFLVNKIDFLRKYNIPEPVAGGLVAANTRVQNVGNRGHTPIYQEQYVWRKTAQGTLFP